MTRLVAGSAKGRILQVPAKGTRPTSERVREAMFSHLENELELSEARVLDLFAGSGALALEALSRGARAAVLVDSGRGVDRILKRNLQDCGFSAQGRVVPLDAQAFLAGAREFFDLVFLDPPYDFPEDKLALLLATLQPRLAPRAIVVVERSTRSPEPTWPDPLSPYTTKKYGETAVYYCDIPLAEEVAD